jgi:NADH-quinone oxidoreductase subunit F
MGNNGYSPILMEGTGGTLLRDGRRETLSEYRDKGGYSGLARILKSPPDGAIRLIKDAVVRGRGGAGFPAGMKWDFIPKDRSKPHYVCCNADESEPGTFSNRVILEQRPHLLIEGVLIACYATLAETGFIYIRGEYYDAIEQMKTAIAEARAAGLIGSNILGTGFSCEIIVYGGAGAYICGEETALLESVEGRRGYPRLRPPFPAAAGLYDCPTVINNVETLSLCALVAQRGVEWFKSIGTEKSPGTTTYCLCGHVKRPGNYEAPLGITLRELIYEKAGGIRNDNAFKAVFPGGSSVPMMFEEALDCPMDFDSPRQYGTFLGSTGMIVMDETVCMVWASLNLMRFYRDESCGQCTPCREGTGWMCKILKRIEDGGGEERDLDILLDICHKIAGRTICALGEFATASVVSGVTRFRDEYMAHIQQKRCPFDENMDFRKF